MNMVTRLITGSFLTLFLIGLSGCNTPAAPEAPIRPVLTQTVKLESLWHDAIYSGDIQARYDTSLGFRIGGKIIDRKVDIGDTVLPGSLLARLDPEDSQLAIANTTAQLSAAKADQEMARSELQRYTALRKKNYSSQAELTRYRNKYNVAKARLRQAEAELAVTRNQSAYTELHSNREGVITHVLAEEGEVVAAGQTVFKLALQANKEVGISVPENRLEEIKSIKKIDISLWAVPDKQFAGEIREISPGADPVTRTYQVKISILDPEPAVQLGMTASARFRRPIPGQVTALPLSALYQMEGKPAVWIVDPDKLTVHLQAITIVEYQETSIIIDSGVKTGDKVVIAGVHKLTPNQSVRLPKKR